MKYRLIILVISSIAFGLLLSSCSPWVVTDQSLSDRWMGLNSSNTVGQTYVANYAGLQAVTFSLRPNEQGSGTLTMHLRSSPASTIDLLKVSLPINQIAEQKQYRFNFPYLSGSNNQYYYSVLTIDGEGSVDVGYGPADEYQNGSAYNNEKPVEAQLSFNLDYDRLAVFSGITQQVLNWLGYFFICLIIFIIPGWALLGGLWSGWDRIPVFEKIPLSIAVSLAFYVFLVLFTFLLHIQLGRWYAWLPILIGAIIILWENRSYFGQLISHKRVEFKPYLEDKSALWVDLCLIFILGLLFISRFWAARSIMLPMWNDSLHHTVITQLLLDNQGLFSSWLPYAAYKTFSMHFGFPLSAALLSWVSGASSGQAVLIMGQVLNILAPLALYPVAVRLTRGNRIAGVVAVLVAGLLSPMPAYYINWGRYAQLAGQVILPVVMWMTWNTNDSITGESRSRIWLNLPWIKIVLTGVVITGMILFEFRMIFIVATFAIALIVAQLARYFRHDLLRWVQELLAIASIGIVSIVFFIPWGIRLQGGRLITYSDFGNNSNSLKELVIHDYQAWQLIRFYIPIGLLIFALIGLVWAIIKKDWLTASIGFWVGLTALLYALILLHIPWVQYVQSFAVLISLYIPVGIFIGYLGGNLADRISTWPPGKGVLLLCIAVLGLFGLWRLRDTPNPDFYAFVTQPDLQAMQWISENTPQNSLFLIEGTHENWVTNIVGTDAGWWLPLLAKRENTIPPQYALSNEQPIIRDYSDQLVELESSLEKTSLASNDGIQLLCDYGITNIYIGQKQGTVGDKAKPLFTPAELADSPVFQLRYHQDRVYIYSIENACN